MQESAKETMAGENREPKHIRIDNQLSNLSEAITKLESFTNSLSPAPQDDKEKASEIAEVPTFIYVLDALPNRVGDYIERIHAIRNKLSDLLI